MIDAYKNLAVSSVATAPSPPTTGTTLTVFSGHGSRFPAVPFNVTVWDPAQLPSPATAEVARVTAMAGDTLTITRAQEGTTARAITANDVIAATFTAKLVADLRDSSNQNAGTLPDARFPAMLPAVSGALLTNLDATDLTNTLPAATFPAILPAVSGTNLTNLNATQLTGGTLPDARLSANVQMKPIAASDVPAHKATHQAGGADAVPLDTLAAPSDVTTLNATTAAHGLLPKLSGAATQFLAGDGAFKVPTNVPGAHHLTHETGGSDPITVLDAAVLTTGVINPARLPATMTPSAHRTSHQSGGTDAIALDTLSAPTDVTTLNASTSAHGLLPKLSGNAAQFLAGDGTFQTPPATTPGAHHLTHEPGGADQIATLDGAVLKTGTINDARLSGNVARRDQANTFGVEPQVFTRYVRVTNNGAPVDGRLFQVFAGADGVLYIQAMNDAGSTDQGHLAISRAGDLTVGNLSPVAGGNVARRDVANTFAADQTIQTRLYSTDVVIRKAGANPRFVLGDTAQATDSGYWTFVVGNQVAYLGAAKDDWTLISPYNLTFDRLGSVKVGADVYEKGRATALGHWQRVPYNASNFQANTGTWTVASGAVNAYDSALLGKTLLLNFYLGASSVSGSPTELQLAVPGAVAAQFVLTPIIVGDSGAVWTTGHAVLNAGEAIIRLRLDPQGTKNWTNGTTTFVAGQLIVPLP